MSKFLEGLFTKPRQPIGQLPLNRPSNISQRKKAEEVQKWFHLRKCSVIKYSLSPSPPNCIIQTYKHCSTWFLISLIKQKWYLTLYSNKMFNTWDNIIFCIFLICEESLKYWSSSIKTAFWDFHSACTTGSQQITTTWSLHIWEPSEHFDFCAALGEENIIRSSAEVSLTSSHMKRLFL